MARPARIVATISVLVVLCAGGGVLCVGTLTGVIRPQPFVHAYPAPGPGCGDTGEDENGVRSDNWDNDDYTGVTCHADHVDIDSGSGTDPRGVHDPSSNVFRVESNIDGPHVSAIKARHHNGFLVTVGVAVQSGGDAARGGITVQPYASNREAIEGIEFPVYFFNIDRSGRWHVDDHDIFGRFRTHLDAGTPRSVPEPSPTPQHVLQVKLDVRTYDLTFTVDSVIVSTVHPQPFDAYLIGVGVGCSYDPDNTRTCMASLKDYQFELWR